mgnify:CR=1 FL=1
MGINFLSSVCARAVRLPVEGGLYYVITRGNGRQEIFGRALTDNTATRHAWPGGLGILVIEFRVNGCPIFEIDRIGLGRRNVKVG